MALYIILSALFIMSASLVGVFFISKNLSGFLEKNLKILIAFSAGVFIVITYSLFKETIEHGLGLLNIFISAIMGAVFLEIITHVIPKAHHHHDTHSEHRHSPIDARRVLFGDAAHNIGDGIILVPAYLAGFWIGFGTTIAIFFHELVQEIAEFFILKEAGYSTKNALLKNFFVSSTIFIGIFISLFLSSGEGLEPYLLAFSAGGFLYIIVRDLLPSIVKTVKYENKKWRFVFALFLGSIVMFSINILTPHEHDHEDEHGHEHESENIVIS